MSNCEKCKAQVKWVLVVQTGQKKNLTSINVSVWAYKAAFYFPVATQGTAAKIPCIL